MKKTDAFLPGFILLFILVSNLCQAINGLYVIEPHNLDGRQTFGLLLDQPAYRGIMPP